jgi:hypothetical protein
VAHASCPDGHCEPLLLPELPPLLPPELLPEEPPLEDPPSLPPEGEDEEEEHPHANAMAMVASDSARTLMTPVPLSRRSGVRTPRCCRP